MKEVIQRTYHSVSQSINKEIKNVFIL